MKNTALVIVAFLFLLQIGCTKAIRYSEEEIKDFPPNVQENIRKGQIDLGMTQEQVRYAWGSPDSIKILEPFEGKSREEWIYSSAGTMGVVGTKLLLFYDGKLIYISK
jgi:outer membrane protein assembly factor BamE (lipoprotein component of BamABCDE complex)